jgi:hypothetical protein
MRDQMFLQYCSGNIREYERLRFGFSTVLKLRILGILKLALNISFADFRRFEVDRKII